MSGFADDASKVSQLENERALEKVKLNAQKFEKGESGDCSNCGNFFERVVLRKGDNYCGGCRDKLNLG